MTQEEIHIQQQVLKTLRQIIRAIDLHSKQLERESGLTGPQLLVLQAVHDRGQLTGGELARAVCLSQATVTSILDRLEARGLLARTRGDSDKRKVWIELSVRGREVLATAPPLLQDSFSEAFNQLRPWEQSLILSSLQRVAEMMQASSLDAAPLIDSPMERLESPRG